MRRVAGFIIFGLFLSYGSPVLAAAPATAAENYCLPYIQRAEKKYRIPRGLLMAIALVESGVNGKPWPWALNVGGTGIYPKTYEEAIKYLRQADGSARPDVAVGCMQIFVRWHGKKFGVPEYMLYPEYNVAYAAQYLRSLYQQHGNWSKAVANYHARENKRAQYDYVCAVFRKLHQIRRSKPSREGLAYCKILPKK
jgi:soluble lytic murein transglycosylase-like protein